jgi:hypothetical protein
LNALCDQLIKEINYILDFHSKFLTYDLKRNFEKKREKDLKESPFDAIINDNLGNK